VSLPRLYAVLDTGVAAGRGWTVADLGQAFLDGGAQLIQLRAKHLDARALLEAADRLVRLAESSGARIIVNDRADVAAMCGAAGVHLGQEDLPVDLARGIAPPGFIIGASVGSTQEAAAAGGADYWGIGPWRVTTTKADAGHGLGPEGFRGLVRLSGGRPCLAIGAVRPEDLASIAAAGGMGVGVVSGILSHADVRAATEAYALAWRPSDGGI
jgi:thiamine-phosphate pyrophosphorylase